MTNRTPTPADLDPNRKNHEPDPVEFDDAKPVEEEVEMIVYRERTPDGEKEHRVPVADWPTYEKEHGF